MTTEPTSLCERLRKESLHLFPMRMRDGHAYHQTAYLLDEAAAQLEQLAGALDGLLACVGRHRPDGYYEFRLGPNRDVEAAKDALAAYRKAGEVG